MTAKKKQWRAPPWPDAAFEMDRDAAALHRDLDRMRAMAESGAEAIDEDELRALSKRVQELAVRRLAQITIDIAKLRANPPADE